MTAPTPSPGSDHPQQHNPWERHGSPKGPRSPVAAAIAGSEVPGGPGHEGGVTAPPPGENDRPASGLPVAREARDALVATVGVGLFGVVLGLLWLWLAPRVPLVANDGAVYLKHPEGEESMGADGTFLLLGLALGAVVGVAVFLLRKRGGVGLVTGLTLGGLLASVIAWRFGVWLGPTSDLAAHAKAVGDGTVFDAPLELHAKGALLACPFAAVAVHLLCTALFGIRDPEPRPEA